MDPYLLVLVTLVIALIASLHRAGLESRRRKRAYAAYYSYPSTQRPRRIR